MPVGQLKLSSLFLLGLVLCVFVCVYVPVGQFKLSSLFLLGSVLYVCVYVPVGQLKKDNHVRYILTMVTYVIDSLIEEKQECQHS